MAIDYASYLGTTPDVTTGNTITKEDILGDKGDTVTDASQKKSPTLGSFLKAAKEVLNTPIFNTLKNVAGKILLNGNGVYDPSRNAVYVGNLRIVGVVDCQIKMPEGFKHERGMDGATTVTRTKTSSPSMELTLLRTSPSIRALDHAYSLMMNEGKGSLEIMVQDNGETVFQGKAVLSNTSDFKLDMEGSDRVYSFQFI